MITIPVEDVCPKCLGDLDTGWECNDCGYDAAPQKKESAYSSMLQPIKISTNLGRKELFELGKRGPYHRYINFPDEVPQCVRDNQIMGVNSAGNPILLMNCEINIPVSPEMKEKREAYLNKLFEAPDNGGFTIPNDS
jgi:hypothetical protein